MNQWIKNSLLMLVALASGAVGFYVFQLSQGQDAASLPEATRIKPIPIKSASAMEWAFAFPDLQGNLRHRDEWAGKILVLNFWATWCGPCKHEIPIFMALQETFAAQGVQFVGIATLDKKADVVDFAQSMGINYPILLGGHEASALSSQLGNTYGVLPFTVITDASGQIRETISGELDAALATKILNNLAQ